MKLNEKLMKLRKERGLSQEEFGNEINVSRQAVSKWEAGTTKPDIEKIKEISNYFDVSFEYLLNDEMDDLENKVSKSKTKNSKHTLLKILFIVFIVYFIWSAYKFIALFRYYKIADSFSEENYWISETDSFYNNQNTESYFSSYDKIGNRIIQSLYSDPSDSNALRDENGELIAWSINFYDYDRKLAYHLAYDENTKTYTYYNNIENFNTEEDWQELFGLGNIVREKTLGYIPSNLKDIFLCSINPIYHVSIKNNTIYMNNFNKIKYRIMLSNDGLIIDYAMMTEFDGGVNASFSYSYVQDHFKDREIKDPIETYKDKISNYSEIEHIK